MKLVTFNIRCDYGQDGINNFSNRKKLILDKINKEKPDIICFQEVLPHIAHWLREVLKEYYVVGLGRDETFGGEQTSIAYRWASFQLADFEVFWLSPTPKLPGSRYIDQSTCPRICTMALFHEESSGKLFRILNLHLDHEGEQARELAVKQVLGKLEEEDAALLVPTIITGDFNAEPGSREMKALKVSEEFTDITSGVGGTFHDFGRLEKEEIIDYIFTSRHFTCVHIERWEDTDEGVYLTDHYPVCAVLNL